MTLEQLAQWLENQYPRQYGDSDAEIRRAGEFIANLLAGAAACRELDEYRERVEGDSERPSPSATDAAIAECEQ